MIIVIILNSIDAVAAVGTKVRLEVRGGKIKKCGASQTWRS